MNKSIEVCLDLFILIASVLFSTSSLQAFLYSYETIVAKCLNPIEITETETNIEGIDCIYVINLDKRPDKWQRMQALFNERGLKVNRVSGIYGKEIPQSIREALQGPYYHDHILPPGVIGCLLSHLSCLKDAYNRGFNRVWIFEDDVDFIDDYKQIPELVDRLSKIDPDWDIFYTDTDMRSHKGGYLKNLTVRPRPDQSIYPTEYYLNRKSIDYNIMRIGQRYGTHCYVVSRKGMEKIIYYYTHSYICAPIDNDLHFIENLHQYSPKKDIITNWTQTSYSDTGDFLFEVNVASFEKIPK